MIEIIAAIILGILVLITLIVLASSAEKLSSFCQKNRIIREECEIELSGMIKLFLKNYLLKPILCNPKVTSNDKKELEKLYRTFKRRYIFYYVIFVAQIVYMAFIIRGIVLNWGDWNSDAMSFRFAILIIAVIGDYCLYLTPIFEAYGKKRLAQIGPNAFATLEKMCDATAKLTWKGLFVLLEFGASAFFIYGFIQLWLKAGFPNTIWFYLIAFLLYQYVFLKLVSKIASFIIKKWDRLAKFRSEKCEHNIYARLKNTTFISLVFLYALAVDKETDSKPLFAALGILFLLDTYFDARGNMKKKEDE